ncbi:ArsR family transcriptional regulator [uncultured Methanobrevibacter sp.]|uniref:ArsR family transcriptional regulator n=1 Tax=uncultured Methanobrevibacter sp. TaxID=253161 RepID=UPI0025FF6FDB|nr:ArsR family transcriptional regulator [uncultured Methanobrevibacter sp.]
MLNEITIVSTQTKLDDISNITEEYNIKKLILVSNKEINLLNLETDPIFENIDINILNLNVENLDLKVSCKEISEFIIKEAEKSSNIVVKLNIENFMLNNALYYATCYNKDIIKSVIMYDTNLHKIIYLPLFDFKLSDAKKVILRNIEDGKNTIEDISKSVNRSHSMVYNHIRDLREVGFIEKDSLKLNNAAKILLSL